MSKTFPVVLASLAIFSTAIFVAPANSDTRRVYQKLPSSGVKLKMKSGYYVQCYYSGLGEICEYVYASVRTANGVKLTRARVKNGPLKKKSGYYVQCYYSGLGEVCEYVYAKPRR